MRAIGADSWASRPDKGIKAARRSACTYGMQQGSQRENGGGGREGDGD